MATIRIDAGKVNKMHGLINDVKKSAADYKSELEGVKKQVLAINRSVCDLDEVLDELRISSDLQDAKMEFCDALTNDIDGFVEEAVRIDREVAARISRRADEFYEEYPWLRPDCRKSGWERFISSFKEAEGWCLDRWKETGLAARRQMAAVLAAVNQGPGQGVTGMAVALPYLVSQFLAENTADAAAWAVRLYQEKKTVRTGVNAAGATYLAVTAPVFAGVLATAEATALKVFDVKNGRGKKKKEGKGQKRLLPPLPEMKPAMAEVAWVIENSLLQREIEATLPWDLYFVDGFSVYGLETDRGMEYFYDGEIGTGGRGDTDQQRINYIAYDAIRYGVPVRTALAVAYTETHIIQWDEDGNADRPGGGVGLMQIQRAVHSEFDDKDYAGNWQVNVDCGMQILKTAYDTAQKATAEDDISVEDLARSTYCLYNGGEKNTQIVYRWTDPKNRFAQHDSNFKKYYDGYDKYEGY